jgi:hypothetical protein
MKLYTFLCYGSTSCKWSFIYKDTIFVVVYRMESFGDVKHPSSYDLEVLELQFNIREQNSYIYKTGLDASGSKPRDGESRLLPGAKVTSEISYR